MTTLNMNEAPPVAPDEASKLPTGDSTPRIPHTAPAGAIKIGKFDLELFVRRVIADAMTDASASNWLRRADRLESVKHDPERLVKVGQTVIGVGDFPGRASVEDLAHRNAAIDAAVLACRQKAELIQGGYLND